MPYQTLNTIVRTMAIAAVLAGAGRARSQELFPASGEEAPVEVASKPEDRTEIPQVDLSETVRQRYPNGKVKIAREVSLNGEGNFVNHGKWEQFASDGTPMIQGQYVMGKKSGAWIRVFNAEETKKLSSEWLAGFQPPLISHVQFENDKLHGVWTMVDAKERQIASIPFVDGKRHGMMVLWHATGKKRYEATFENSSFVGLETQWDSKGKEVAKATYIDGRAVTLQVKRYKNKKIESQAELLRPKRVIHQVDDWFLCRLASYRYEGEVVKHGMLRTYYSTGQLRSEGAYERGLEIGKHTWWYDDGQIEAEGHFIAGQREGLWVWRYDNGLPMSRGNYSRGQRVGSWMAWDEAGKLKAVSNVEELKSAAQPIEPKAIIASEPKELSTEVELTDEVPVLR